jgi:putative ATPase
VLYDKEGDYHFDTISAFIKSLRGSDPDAAVYWLAKMVYAGEDARFLFRRMIIFAAEDIGLADPNALVVAESNASAFDRVGLPEGRFHLGNTAIYLATAPKSNSVFAFFDALQVVETERDSDVPVHLRDDNRDGDGFGHGAGYLYPHAYRGHWVAQQYLPDSLQGRVFYQPTRVGYEAAIHDAVIRNREAQLAAMLEREGVQQEILTAAPAVSSQEKWVERAMSGQSEEVRLVRERVLAPLSLQRHGLVLVLNAASGFLVWEAMRRVPEGGVWALVEEESRAGLLEHPPFEVEAVLRPAVLVGGLEELPSLLAARGEAELRFEALIGSNALTQIPDRCAVLASLRGLLRPGGSLSIAEVVPGESQRLSELIADSEPQLLAALERAEAGVYGRGGDSRTGWATADLRGWAEAAGFAVAACEGLDVWQERRLGEADIGRWLDAGAPYGRALAAAGSATVDAVSRALRGAATGGTVRWRRRIAFLTATAPGGVAQP